MDESYCPGCGTMGEGSECAPGCERAPKEIVREPYSYSLPEKFLQDQSVPARWRVWAVINGFFLNGGKCWASNGWISERIGVHKDTVSQAVKELEEQEVVVCERRARGRDIFPMIGTSAYLRSAPTPIKSSHDRRHRLSNSISSNSVKESTVAIAPGLSKEEVPDEETPPKKVRDSQGEKCAAYWVKKCKEEAGQAPSGGLPKLLRVIKDARKTVSYPQIKQMMDEWFENESQEPHEMIQITRCLSSFRIDKFLAENV